MQKKGTKYNKSVKFMNGILVNGSVTNKTKTQDRHGKFYNSSIGFSGVIVADGIGSMPFAEVAAEYFVENSIKYLENFKEKKVNISTMFKELHYDFLEFIFKNQYEKQVEDLENSLGTTFIVAIEYQDCFEIGYIGNGSIFHWRGNFFQFNEKVYHIPWTAFTNYLNPDSIVGNEGKETLIKFFSPNTNEIMITPTIVSISKDNLEFGDILMICTDGIFSFDQAICGVQTSSRPKYLENRWMPYSPQYSLILDSFRAMFQSSQSIIGERELQENLDKGLLFLKENKMLDDDATAAIIFSNTFLQKINKKWL